MAVSFRFPLLLILCASFIFTTSANFEYTRHVTMPLPIPSPSPSPSPFPSPSPSPSVTPSPFPDTTIPLHPVDGECMSIEAGSLYFCDNLVYDIFVPYNQTIWDIDALAYSTYLQGSLSLYESCCQLPYKDYVCATLFPRCEYNGIEAVPLHPCSNWVCNAVIVDGPNVQFCFLCDSTVLEFSETCSCPNGNASWNSECLASDVYNCLDSGASSLFISSLGVVVVALSSFFLSF